MVPNQERQEIYILSLTKKKQVRFFIYINSCKILHILAMSREGIEQM